MTDRDRRGKVWIEEAGEYITAPSTPATPPMTDRDRLAALLHTARIGCLPTFIDGVRRREEDDTATHAVDADRLIDAGVTFAPALDVERLRAALNKAMPHGGRFTLGMARDTAREYAALTERKPDEAEACGATHPNGKTHCRQDRGHPAPHATARRDVVWVDDYDAEELDPASPWNRAGMS